MVKLAFWLIVVVGVYLYARNREARKQLRERIREEQRRRAHTVDVEAEVIEETHRP